MKLELIEQWPTVLWRSATTRIAAVTGLIVGVVGAHYLVLLGVLPFLPPYLQLPLALLIGAVVVAPTIAARLFAQPKMVEKVAEKAAEKTDAVV